jgi:predicted nucleotidyltransferase component of viral defense system
MSSRNLVITLALFDVFRDEGLKAALAFRGGTVLHKLHLPPAARYSEDIDLVQREPGPIGPTLSRLRRVLGWIGPARSETGEHPKLTFRFETETGGMRKVKLEINSHEHFGHVVPRLFAVPDLPVGNSAAVPTHSLDEILATKLRALYQRRKGRDLFDLWWADQQADPDAARIVALLGEYQAAAGRPMIRASELRMNLAAKRVRSFLEEVGPLLRPGVTYDPIAALDWVEGTFIPLLL